MANLYDKRSANHAGYKEGTKVETIIDHHEVNGDLYSGTILTTLSIVHYPTRIIAVDDSGLEWTLPLYSIKIHDILDKNADTVSNIDNEIKE